MTTAKELSNCLVGCPNAKSIEIALESWRKEILEQASNQAFDKVFVICGASEARATKRVILGEE
jgi:hypothetical protein